MNKLNIPDRLFYILQKAKITTAESILITSDIKLKKIGFKNNEIELIRLLASENLFPGFSTIPEYEVNRSEQCQHISTSCSDLDTLLEGGIPIRGITEIYGEAGSGKTQLCLQLAVSIQLPLQCCGREKGTLFICTEEAFQYRRLCQIVDAFKERYQNQLDNINFTENIFVDHLNEIKDLINCVKSRLPWLMKHRNIGLIVIDSIGAIFRTELNIITRANDLRLLIRMLNKIAEEHNCAIVCINQVTSLVNNEVSKLSNLLLKDDKILPCLGMAWANLINTRLRLSRTDKTHVIKETNLEYGYVKKTTITVRKMSIIFSSALPQTSAEFLITADGITNVNELIS